MPSHLPSIDCVDTSGAHIGDNTKALRDVAFLEGFSVW